MSHLNDVIKTAIENLQEIIDANTIVGKAITTDNGTTLIPVSKVTVGIASGGVDYVSKKNANHQNFGGGNGAGVNVSPVAFIVVTPDGDVKMLNMNATSVPDAIDSIDKLVTKAPEIIEKIKAIIPKKKKNKDGIDSISDKSEDAE